MRSFLAVLLLIAGCMAQTQSEAKALVQRLNTASLEFNNSLAHRGVTEQERATAVAKYEAALKPILTDVRVYRKATLPKSTAEEDKQWDFRFANESPVKLANGLERYLLRLEAKK